MIFFCTLFDFQFLVDCISAILKHRHMCIYIQMTHARRQTGLENIKGLINFISLSCSTMYLLCKKKKIPLNLINSTNRYALIKSIIPHSGQKKRIDDQPLDEKLWITSTPFSPAQFSAYVYNINWKFRSLVSFCSFPLKKSGWNVWDGKDENSWKVTTMWKQIKTTEKNWDILQFTLILHSYKASNHQLSTIFYDSCEQKKEQRAFITQFYKG